MKKRDVDLHLVKDTWTTEWLPVLSSVLMLISSLFTLVLLYLYNRNFPSTKVITIMGLVPAMLFLACFLLRSYGSLIKIVFSLVVVNFHLLLLLSPTLRSSGVALLVGAGLIVGTVTAVFQLWNSAFSIKHDGDNKRCSIVNIFNVKPALSIFGNAVRLWWVRHPRLAEFIRFYAVANFVTLLQFALVPFLQLLFKKTFLVDVDFHMFGPIGAGGAHRMETINGVTALNPYYVFNYTGGEVNGLVEKNLNNVPGLYWAHGGLAYFLAMFMTLVIAQIINFVMQRNIAFKSKSNVLKAAFWYALATIIITVGNSALYGFYQPWLFSRMGETLGGIIAAFFQALISFWVFYPILRTIFK